MTNGDYSYMDIHMYTQTLNEYTNFSGKRKIFENKDFKTFFKQGEKI